MEWLRGQLKALAAVRPPDSVLSRLEAGVPVAASGPIIRGDRPKWLAVRWAGVAAGVLLGASVAVWFGAPWVRRAGSAMDANSSRGRVYATDHNGLRLADANLCDFNSPR